MTDAIAKKFKGLGICSKCHGRGTVTHPHYFRFGTDDPCDAADCVKGAVIVMCDTSEEATTLTNELHQHQANLKAGKGDGYAVVARVVGSVI